MGVPNDQKAKVIAALRANIEANNEHLDTGIFGTQFLFEVLSENDMNDLAYRIMNQRTEPGYGHWLELGSTTSREHWNEGGSHNHPMFGGGLVWLYRKLAGMQEDPEEPGYRHIIFRPQPVKEMEHVTYSNLTPYGKAGISWKHQSGKFFMDVEVPVGSRATVYVPAESKDQVLESGKKPDKDKGVEFKEMQDGYAVFEVSSGIYKFQAPVIGN